MPKKILILDDDQDIASLMEILLRREGYEVVTAYSSGIFKELDTINPDLILMDNLLWNGYGKDYCRQLKEDPTTAHFKIVLVSAAADLESFAAECKADAFLSKPFDVAKLAVIVGQLTT